MAENQNIIEIPLTRGHVAIVDEIDADLAKLKWYWNGVPGKRDGYAARGTYEPSTRTLGTQAMHRVILKRMHGDSITKDQLCDHANGIRTDNRRCNLRLVCHAENVRNARKTNRPGKSSVYKGVCWDRSKAKWMAGIKTNYRNKFLGRFDDELDVALCYDAGAAIMHGQFACFNFPENWRWNDSEKVWIKVIN